MNKTVLKAIKSLQPGCLVSVEWLDASRASVETVSQFREGEAGGVTIDLPVISWGIFIGVYGKKAEHIVIVASKWHFTGGYGQVDCTVIPLSTIEKIDVIKLDALEAKEVCLCQQAFIHGRSRRLTKRIAVKTNV